MLTSTCLYKTGKYNMNVIVTFPKMLNKKTEVLYLDLQLRCRIGAQQMRSQKLLGREKPCSMWLCNGCAVPCHVMLCCAMLHHATPCHAVGWVPTSPAPGKESCGGSEPQMLRSCSWGAFCTMATSSHKEACWDCSGKCLPGHLLVVWFSVWKAVPLKAKSWR